jgi:glycosyltransferase involved in cell wall biosynthesis
MNPESRIALVVQRFGPDLVGGAESLCRTVAKMLGRYWPVEVLTTCAKDYSTWRNEYPAGTTVADDLVVRRFPVDYERDVRFHRLFGRMLGGLPLSAYPDQKLAMRALLSRGSFEEQEELIRLQGPHSTPLLDFLAEHEDDYTAILFFTYLYSPTYFGAQLVSRHKAILVPTAHDEAMIFVPAYRRLFERANGFIFLTPEERQFVARTFDVTDAFQATIGLPVSLGVAPDERHFRKKYRVEGPYLLYAGRIDPSKGCDSLFRYYRESRKQGAHDLPLILIGDRAMEMPRDRHIRYLGRVSEQDKVSAMAAASVVINPSQFESFSISTLEAMASGAASLVNGRCEVLKGHVLRSSAGLYYENGGEFAEALRLLLSNDAALARRLGQNGRLYAEQNYDSEATAERYRCFLEGFLQQQYPIKGIGV